MATVTYGDYEPFEIDDNRADLIAYYRGEGAEVAIDDEGSSDELSEEISDPGAGEELHGVEHPADGTMSPEISNDPAGVPDPLDLH